MLWRSVLRDRLLRWLMQGRVGRGLPCLRRRRREVGTRDMTTPTACVGWVARRIVSLRMCVHSKGRRYGGADHSRAAIGWPGRACEDGVVFPTVPISTAARDQLISWRRLDGRNSQQSHANRREGPRRASLLESLVIRWFHLPSSCHLIVSYSSFPNAEASSLGFIGIH